jgi:hypothetical protein
MKDRFDIPETAVYPLATVDFRVMISLLNFFLPPTIDGLHLYPGFYEKAAGQTMLTRVRLLSLSSSDAHDGVVNPEPRLFDVAAYRPKSSKRSSRRLSVKASSNGSRTPTSRVPRSGPTMQKPLRRQTSTAGSLRRCLSSWCSSTLAPQACYAPGWSGLWVTPRRLAFVVKIFWIAATRRRSAMLSQR